VELSKKEQEKLVEFARFLAGFNPEYKMAPGFAAKFKDLRSNVLPIVDRVTKGD
jgi:hypothetical protein